MFLIPTAKPTPRRTPSPRVVLPEPPGGGSGRGAAPRARADERGAASDHLGHGQRAGDQLAGRKHVAGRDRVEQAQLDRLDVERGGELVHLRLVREAALHGAESAHRAARRVVRVDARAFDEDVVDAIGAGGEAAGIRRAPRVELDA